MVSRERTVRAEAMAAQLAVFQQKFRDALVVGLTPTESEIDVAIDRFATFFSEAMTVLASATTEEAWDTYLAVAGVLPKNYPSVCVDRALEHLKNGVPDPQSSAALISARVLSSIVPTIQEQADSADLFDGELMASSTEEGFLEALHEILTSILISPASSSLDLSKQIGRLTKAFYSNKTVQQHERKHIEFTAFSADEDAGSRDRAQTEYHWQEYRTEIKLLLLGMVGKRPHEVTNADIFLLAERAELHNLAEELVAQYAENPGELYQQSQEILKMSDKYVGDRMKAITRLAYRESPIKDNQDTMARTEGEKSVELATISEIDPTAVLLFHQAGLPVKIDKLIELDIEFIKRGLSSIKISDNVAKYYLYAISIGIQNHVAANTWLPPMVRKLSKWEQQVLRPQFKQLAFTLGQNPGIPFGDLPLFVLKPSEFAIWAIFAKNGYYNLGNFASIVQSSEANITSLLSKFSSEQLEVLRSILEQLVASNFHTGDREDFLISFKLLSLLGRLRYL